MHHVGLGFLPVENASLTYFEIGRLGRRKICLFPNIESRTKLTCQVRVKHIQRARNSGSR